MSDGDGQRGREELKTVPPPDGAEDPYSAKTRVAPLSDHVLDALREYDAEHERLEHAQSGTRLTTAAPFPSEGDSSRVPDADSSPTPDDAGLVGGSFEVIAHETTSPLLERVVLVVAVLAVLGALAFVVVTLLAY